MAASITLPVVLNGNEQDMTIEYYGGTRTAQDNYGGVKQNTYSFSVLSITFGAANILFDEVLQKNARLITLVYPEGHSYVGFNWDFSWNCHGGCGANGYFAVELSSPTSALFFDSPTLPADFLKPGHAGKGAFIINTFWNNTFESVNMPTSTSLTKFTVLVPEAGSLPMALGGLAMVGALILNQRRKATDQKA
ncbi:MAG: hypothetical protein C0487_04220 [Leptothrix sp. (in: Bacteria)]|nr:hypothetical protein [Leptothrix sp. (in: b-proteobacteria)]